MWALALAVLCAVGTAWVGTGVALASPPNTAIRYDYDADGHLKAVVVPGSETALYSWDAAGNLTSIGLKQSKSLSIIQLTPSQGAVGETVTISGTGFSIKPAADTVKFNGTTATVNTATEWTLTVTVPKGATSGTVSVQTTEGPVTSVQKFTVMSSPAPTITSLSASKALVGETITVNGTNFETNRVNDVVKLNQSFPVFSSVTSTSLQLKVPSATGSGRVSVATPQGSASGPDLFIPPESLPVSKVEATGRVSLGGAETVKLPSPEKIGLELFDGTVGQHVSLEVSESTIAHGYISLWGPEGKKLSGSEIGFSSGEAGFDGPFTLPSTGTYTVYVRPEGANTGSVKLQTYSVVDQTGEVKPITEGAKAEVSLTTPGQRAIFTVPGSAGGAVSLQTSGTSFSKRYTVEWRDEKGELVYSEWWNGTTNVLVPAVKFSATEKYTLTIAPWEGGTGTQTLTFYNASDVTGSLTVGGEAVKVPIAAPGQKARITFSGTGGQRVSLTTSESSITRGVVSFLNPEGKQLEASEALFTSSEPGFDGPITLPSTGTYTVYVKPEDAYTGGVTLRAYSVVDQTGEVKPTTEGVKAEVSLTTPGQRAIFTVPGSAGEAVSIVTSSSSFSKRYWIEWYNEKGERVYAEWWNGTTNVLVPSVKFPATEKYMLVIAPWEGGTGAQTLMFYDASDVAGSLTVGGEAVKVPIVVPGQKGRITFAGKEGQRVSLVASESSITHGTVSILNPEGKQLGGSEVVFSSSEAGFDGPITLPSTGTYTVYVKPEGAYTGGVTLRAYSVVDQAGEVKPTTEGVKAEVSLTTPGQRAIFTVPGSAGEAVSIVTSSSSFSKRYWIEWYNEKGERVYAEWWNGTTNVLVPSVKFPATEKYMLVIAPWEGGTGTQTLTFYDASDVTGSITPGGEPVKVTIGVPGQKARLKFAATEGQLLTLKSSEVTIANGWMSIWDPEEKKLSGSEVNFTGTAKDEFTPPTTGTYTIFLDPEGADTGSLTLTFYKGPHAAPIHHPAGDLSQERAPSRPPLSLPLAGSGALAGGLDAPTPRGPAPPTRHSSKTHPGQPRTARPSLHRHARPRARRAQEPLGYPLAMRRFRPLGTGVWNPPRHRGRSGAWESLQPATPWAKVPALHGAEGATALAGQVLALDGLPLAGVRLAVEDTYLATQTDSAGRFLLSGLPAGHQVLVIEGNSVSGRERYGIYEDGVDLAANRTTTLGYTIWLTPLDRSGDRRIASPTPREVRLTTPKVPGLEVRLPAGSVIKDASGKIVHDLNLTAIPTDRPPFPLPAFVEVPVYFTVQPGRAYLNKGAQIVYPNWGHLPPGQRVEFWNYDADSRGWYVYGHGTVTPDGKQVMPDPGVRVWEFTGAMIAGSPTPPASGPHGGNPAGGDPVDLGTGLFVYHKTDLRIPDTIPIVIERTYREADSNSYSFGVGTANRYDMRLWSNNNYHEADLVLPNGGRIHYVRTSPGTGYTDAIYESSNVPGPYYASTIKWDPSITGWELTLTSGTTYLFGEFAPLQAIRDRFGNQLTITREGGTTGNITQITSPHGRWVTFGYDGSNRITEVSDNGGRQLKYTYASGLLSTATDAAGRITKYEYNGSNQLKSVTDPRGKKYIEAEYDGNGRVSKQITGDGGTYTFAYTLKGEQVEATTVTDPRKVESKTTFNTDGYPTSQVRAIGTGIQQTTTYEREGGTGQLLGVTDPHGRKTTYQQDKYGNVTKVTRLAGTESARTTSYTYEPGTNELASVTDALKHTTKYQYGPQGELLSITDPLAHKTSYEYNPEVQPTAVTNALGKTTKLAYENGVPVSTTDPLGHRTSRFVDALGRIGTVTRPGGQTTTYEYGADNEITKITDPLGVVTSYEYNGDGGLAGTTDPLKHKSAYGYDPMDRLESETDPLEHTTKAVYDTYGNLTQLTDRRGKVSEFVYDSLDRLTEAKYGVSGKTAERTATFGYDNANRLIKIVDSIAGTYTLEYDEFNDLKAIIAPTGTVSYGYDEASERTSMTAPEQEALKYTYDAAGRLTELKRGTQTAGYAYDAANRRNTTKLVNGMEERYNYDEANELTSISYKNGASTLGELDYGYDANGRRETFWGSYAATSMPEPITEATYNADNEQTKLTGTKLNTTKLSYDLNGNLTTTGSSQYKWDARNQLTGITGATTATFVYDPYGRRITKTIAGLTTKDIYDGPNVVQETTGSSTTNLTTALGADEILARTVGKTTESYLTDTLGSTTGLANSTAKIQTKYHYDPFGTTKLTGAASENPNQFAGRENDGDGLYYNRARYYNPEDTRFISQDPYGQAANGPNLYLYTEDSPVNATDPYGTQSLASLPGPGNTVFPAPGGPGGTGAGGGGGGAGGGGAGAAGASGGGGFSPGGPGPGPGAAGGPGGSSRSGGYKRQTLEEENEQEEQEENETEGDKLDNRIQTFCDLSGPAGLMISRSSPWVGGAAAAGCAGFSIGNFIFRPILEL